MKGGYPNTSEDTVLRVSKDFYIFKPGLVNQTIPCLAEGPSPKQGLNVPLKLFYVIVVQ